MSLQMIIPMRQTGGRLSSFRAPVTFHIELKPSVRRELAPCGMAFAFFVKNL